MNNIYCRNLKLPIDFKYDKINFTRGITKFNIIDINDDFINFFDEKNLSFRHCEVFHLKKGDELEPHVDTNELGNQVKLNYVKCDTYSLMNWYDCIDKTKINQNKTEINTKYLEIDQKYLKKVYSTQIGWPSLVNVGQFHSISKVESNRTCYSLVLSHKNNNQHVNFKEALEIFKEYII